MSLNVFARVSKLQNRPLNTSVSALQRLI
jgi:hypothetical protein